MSESYSKLSLNTNNNDGNNIKEYRCPKCSTIPFIQISNNENKMYMSINCTNNHNYTKTFDEMKKLLDYNSINNNKCKICLNENKNNTEICYYCSNCFNFYCFQHGKSHDVNSSCKNKIFPINNFDSICTEHNGVSVVGYCFNHNKNYCIRCTHFSENNKKIVEEFTDEQI